MWFHSLSWQQKPSSEAKLLYLSDCEPEPAHPGGVGGGQMMSKDPYHHPAAMKPL